MTLIRASPPADAEVIIRSRLVADRLSEDLCLTDRAKAVSIAAGDVGRPAALCRTAMVDLLHLRGRDSLLKLVSTTRVVPEASGELRSRWDRPP